MQKLENREIRYPLKRGNADQFEKEDRGRNAEKPRETADAYALVPPHQRNQ
jgi:hypothetical protein